MHKILTRDFQLIFFFIWLLIQKCILKENFENLVQIFRENPTHFFLDVLILLFNFWRHTFKFNYQKTSKLIPKYPNSCFCLLLDYFQ